MDEKTRHRIGSLMYEVIGYIIDCYYDSTITHEEFRKEAKDTLLKWAKEDDLEIDRKELPEIISAMEDLYYDDL